MLRMFECADFDNDGVAVFSIYDTVRDRFLSFNSNCYWKSVSEFERDCSKGTRDIRGHKKFLERINFIASKYRLG